MNQFIHESDYKTHLQSEHLEQILSDPTYSKAQILADAEQDAIAVINDALKGVYDTEQIFSKRGNERPRSVLRWATILVVYMIYERIPDDFIPKRVIKNYDDVLELLKQIAKGQRKVDLPLLMDENKKVKTRFRWGSEKPRAH